LSCPDQESDDGADGQPAPHVRELHDALVRCYPRLRGLMQEAIKRQPGPDGSPTNSPTALTHDLIERLTNQRSPIRDDEHLMALASTFAIRVIADDRRRRLRAMRGEGNRGGELNSSIAAEEGGAPNLERREALRSALSRFSATHRRAAAGASLRFLCDLTHEQVAQALGVSVPTVERDWQFAKAWLADDLRSQGYGPNAD